MNDAAVPERRRLLVRTAALAVILIIGWVCYSPAFGGAFLLDDYDNLGGLARVQDSDTALYFVLSGNAGPTGRPVALASFLPHAEHWAEDATPFIRVNILIHLLNGVLLYLFVRQLLTQRDPRDPAVDFIALVATALWLLMPLVASSSLMIVQRMTTLSALFVLAGLNGYLLARSRIGTRPVAAMSAMGIALIVATLLATLSKENGALLPVLVLVLEATLLRPPTTSRSWRLWCGVFLWLPTIAVLVFVVNSVSYSESMILRRDFSGWERLITQSRVLWEYVFAAFVPRPGSFSPFHEAYPVARSLFHPLTFLAAAGWLLLLAASLAWRRKYPVAAFGVLWFIAGHLLESTTYPLELYFEHRNYVPIIGPVLALAILAGQVAGDYRKYARAAVVGYAIIGAAMLFSVSSTWGKPLQAATFWYLRQPDSVRAATTLATRQLELMGPGAALVTMQQFTAWFPQHGYIGIPTLSIACVASPDSDHSESIQALRTSLPDVRFSFTTVSMLDELLTIAMQGDCPSVTVDDVAALAEAVLENEAYLASRRYQQLHYKLLARIARSQGRSDDTLALLLRALDYSRDDDLTMMIVTTLVDDNQFDAAREYIDSAENDLPVYPVRRLNSRNHLRALTRYIDEAEALARKDGEPELRTLTEIE